MRVITGKKAVLETVPLILHDESHYSSGVPRKVCYPETSSDLQCIMQEASSNSMPVTFVGAQTGTTGGAAPVEGCIAVCFSAMNKINSIKKVEDSLVLYCDPGVILSSIHEFLHSPRDWPSHVDGIDILGDNRYMYPPDPTETSAQLGGTVAANASGARSFRFGPTRNFVNYLGCMLPTGEKLEIHRGKIFSKNNSFKVTTSQGRTIDIPSPGFTAPQTKNASGYFSRPGMDLIDLFIGSEGTLGALYEIGIRLVPEVDIISGMSFFASCEPAFDFADFLRRDSQVISIEYFDDNSLSLITNNHDRLPEKFPDYPEGKSHAIFWEFMEGSPGSFESRYDSWEERLALCGSSFDHTWSGFDPAERERLRKFRHAIPELINSLIAAYKTESPSIRKIGTDTALPATVFRSVYREYLFRIKKRSLDYASFGHLGDYHLHINIIPSNEVQLNPALEVYREIMDITIGNGGTISAEHGIGKIKKEFFRRMYSADALSQMKAIKAALDPRGILNCGNLF